MSRARLIRSMSSHEMMEWRALWTVRAEELAEHQAMLEAKANAKKG